MATEADEFPIQHTALIPQTPSKRRPARYTTGARSALLAWFASEVAVEVKRKLWKAAQLLYVSFRAKKVLSGDSFKNCLSRPKRKGI